MPQEKTILWIEDDRFLLHKYKRMLEKRGYTVHCAYSPREGIDFLRNRSQEIDEIFLDIMMDEQEGIDEIDSLDTKGGWEYGIALYKWIRRNYPHLPLLVCSASDDQDVQDWFEKQGIRFIIKRPLEKFDNFVREIEEPAQVRQKDVKGFRAFIVHGDDEESTLALKNYLQNTLELDEPVILRERPSLGRTLIEKFEDEAKDKNLVFAILTPDDEGSKRAPQDVILELGYFLGRLGRRKGRVFLLHKGEIELPASISGLLCIDITNGVEQAGEAIRREIDALKKDR